MDEKYEKAKQGIIDAFSEVGLKVVQIIQTDGQYAFKLQEPVMYSMKDVGIHYVSEEELLNCEPKEMALSFKDSLEAHEEEQLKLFNSLKGLNKD